MKNKTWRGLGAGQMLWPVSLAVLAFLAWLHLADVRKGAAASGDLWLVSRYALMTAFGIGAAAVLGALLFRNRAGKKNARLETVFAVSALVFGALYLYVLPPLCAPDEINHYVSAYHLSNCWLGIGRDAASGQVPMRVEDWFAEDSGRSYRVTLRPDGYLEVSEEGAADHEVIGYPLNEKTYRRIHEKGMWGYEDGRTIVNVEGGAGAAGGGALTGAGSAADDSAAGAQDRNEIRALSIGNPVGTTPAAYVVPALGITAARLLGLNNLWVLYLGRLFNLLFYTAVVTWAMHRLPFGKEVLFGVGLLPMTIHLTASFSYDVLLLAGMALFTAVCLDLAYRRDRVRAADVLLLAAIMALAGPCKIVYTVLMGLCLLIPVRKFGGRPKWLLAAACVLGAWVGAMALLNAQTVSAYASGGENFIEWAQAPGYTAGSLLGQPLRCVRILYETLVEKGGEYHWTMIGSYLGNLDTMLDVPDLVVLFLTAALLLLAFRKPGENLTLRGGRRAWALALCLLCAAAVLMSMLLAWTPVNSPIVIGVQGRYFLPVLPLFLICCKNDLIVLTKDVNRQVLFLMMCADVYVAVRIFSIVCARV